MTHVTEQLAQFAGNLKFEQIPAAAVEATGLYLADYFAACFAGYRVNSAYNQAVRDVLFDMGGREEASVLFSDRKLPVMNAAFLLATYAHGADIDDGNRKAMGHVGAHVISTVLSLGETLPDVSGKDLVTAIQVGYEVYNRVAAAAQPGLVHRGFHSTGTAGVIACAAAAAKLMKLDGKGIYAAMSLAAVQASGLLLIAESGQACKPVNPANAARNGIFSAKIAASGVDCPKYPLESDKGWLHAMTDAPDERRITDGLGEVFTITESYLKPYPSCRHTHCGIECGERLRERMLAKSRTVSDPAKSLSPDRIPTEDILAVDVHIYPNAIQIAGQIKTPRTADDAKFSIHYSLATALVSGGFRLSDLNVSDISPEVTALIPKIRLIADPAMEDRDRGIRGSRVVVHMTDGTQLEETVLIPKGDAANPFSVEDMRRKLSSSAEGLLSPAGQERLLAAVRSIGQTDRFPSVRALTKE